MTTRANDTARVLHDLAADTGAGKVGLESGRTVQKKVSDVFNFFDSGAVGDGVADDTSAITSGIVDASPNGFGNLGKGTFNVKGISVPSDFGISGYGKRATTIKRIANSNGFNSVGTDGGITLSGFTLNMDKTGLGYDGHGVAFDGKAGTVKDAIISDFGSTSGGGGAGVVFYGSVGRKYNRLSDCDFIGNTTTLTTGISYGWIYEDTDTSFASNIYASTIANYAHELKNSATYNCLSGLIADNSGSALGYGQDTGTGPSYNLAQGVVSKACDIGFVVEYGNYNLVNGLLHSNASAPNVSGTSHLLRFENGSRYNSIFGAVGVGLFSSTVHYDGRANYSQVVSHDTTSTLVSLVSGASKNATEVSHPGARTTIITAISDSSGNSIRGANSNPVWCHATGERVGSLSGKFRDRLGASGAIFSANHYWISESDQYAIHTFATPGTSGDSAGIAYSTPASSTQGSFIYQKGASDSADYWTLRVGHTSTFRFFNRYSEPRRMQPSPLGIRPPASPIHFLAAMFTPQLAAMPRLQRLSPPRVQSSTLRELRPSQRSICHLLGSWALSRSSPMPPSLQPRKATLALHPRQ